MNPPPITASRLTGDAAGAFTADTSWNLQDLRDTWISD
jgi:hypothetical protein